MNANRIKIPAELKEMNKIFKKNGFEAYLVGGAVRDVLLGKKASDWDLATNATPDKVSSLFNKVIPTGIAHGTVTVLFKNHKIEVTTYRADQGYSDGRHPDKVIFASTIQEDLSRRDFTMNAIAANLEDGILTDPFGGRSDIRKKLIKTVGNSHERFMEDGLRPIRALRFATQLNFEIEKSTFDEISHPDVQKKINSISIERFRDEFEKILLAETPSKGIFLLEKTGLLKMFIRELAECRGVDQKDGRAFHDFDVLDHCLYSCDGAPETLCVRLAALFHDIGKKDTRTVSEENIPGTDEKINVVHFYRHEQVSAETAEKILTRLRFPNSVVENVSHLIKNHMFHYESNWSKAAVRRFIIKVGAENIDSLFDLRLADIYGSKKQKIRAGSETMKNLLEFKERIEEILEEKSALSLKDLKINGKDLIEAGIPAGKKLGAVLAELFQAVIDDPSMNEREILLDSAKKIYENS